MADVSAEERMLNLLQAIRDEEKAIAEYAVSITDPLERLEYLARWLKDHPLTGVIQSTVKEVSQWLEQQKGEQR